MTADTEVKYKWEEINDLSVLKRGDEVELVKSTDHSEYKHWGTVIDVRDTGVHVSGDWYILPSTLTSYGGVPVLKRKVVVFEWPDYVGASVEAVRQDGTTYHYVRVAESGYKEWVCAETGEYSATWEMEMVCEGDTLRVVGRGY